MKYFRSVLTYDIDGLAYVHSAIRSCEDADYDVEKSWLHQYLLNIAFKEVGVYPAVYNIDDTDLTLTQWNRLTIIGGRPMDFLDYVEDFSMLEDNELFDGDGGLG
jgi:hypothetical protein